MKTLHEEFDSQRFDNDYQLVNGVTQHTANPAQFQIPPDVIKKHIGAGIFVEIRIDSPRFSMHQEDVLTCSCPSCHGELSKPVLRHDHPESFIPKSPGKIPSRGWGEDFWVRINRRDGQFFHGTVDNSLIESRLHGLDLGDPLIFHEDHVLAVHPVHRQELVIGMDAADLKELARWLRSLSD